MALATEPDSGPAIGRSRARLLVVMPLLAAVCPLGLGGPAASAPGATPPSGGPLRILAALGLDSPIDPARAQPGPLMGSVWQSVCATLMAFRDAPAPNGFKVRPEAAAGPPKVSPDGRTYVFTVRKGLRFSDGTPLRAANFVAALHRVFDKSEGSYGAFLLSDVKSFAAKGRRVVIRLRKPAADLPMRMALPYACPVPRGFPVGPAGELLKGGSGPYRVASYVPDKQLVLMRNLQYRGHRPQRIGSVVFTLGGRLQSDIRSVENGHADVLGAAFPPEL